jgi:hypothetical protein
MHGLGTEKMRAIVENCRAKQSSKNLWNQNIFLFALVYECCSFIKGLRPDKLRLTAHCVQEFNKCQESRESMPSIEMEEVLIASNLDNEREVRDVNLGVEG